MSIMETNETKAPAKKKTRKRKVAKPAAAPQPTGMFAGMTVGDCCNACNANGCVISGKSYCAHPRKGGLHANEMDDESALQRRRQAEKVLGKQKLVAE